MLLQKRFEWNPSLSTSRLIILTVVKRAFQMILWDRRVNNVMPFGRIYYLYKTYEQNNRSRECKTKEKNGF